MLKKLHARRQHKARWKLITTRYRYHAIILTTLVLLLAIFFPTGPALKYTYQLNEIAREPVIAPFTFPILKTDEKLQADLDEALKAEPFLFVRNSDVVEKSIQNIHDFFVLANDLREAYRKYRESEELVYRYRYEPQYADAKTEFSADSAKWQMLEQTFAEKYPFKTDQEPWASFLHVTSDTLPWFNQKQFEDDIVQICRNRWAEGIYDIERDKIISREVMIAQGDVPETESPDAFNDLQAAWIKARVEINKMYEGEKDIRRDLGYPLIVEFMKPNLIYDKETTERRQQARLDRVPRYQGTVLKDERIVDKNTRITPDILQKLTSLSLAMNQRERSSSFLDKALAFTGRTILIGVIISFFFTFLLLYRKHVYDDWRMILLISLVFLTGVGIAHVVVIRMDASEYLIPISVAAMVLTILFDARIGFMSITSMAILTGIMIGNNLDFIVVTMFTSSIAMYNIRQLRTRSQLFTTMFALIGASILVVIGLALFKNYSLDKVENDLIFLIINSVAAPIITYGLIGLLEMVFNVTTDLTLIELLDFDHPLLKRLQREANGTFNHSIVVGNLAEACADAIGARALLCRVGAYYHDIGKMTHPEYFIENQFLGKNKHNTLTATMSAKIIRNHVREGLRLAEEYGLPKIVSDFIPMHHGTTRVEYFYLKAVEEAGGKDKVDETAFRYPGPKPNSKETGILMICEAAEAAIRSIKDPDIFKIEAMLDRIIQKRIGDGQLSECPLTLDELRKIKGTIDGHTGMLPVLRGIYHIRVEYPEDEEQPPNPDEVFRRSLV